MTGLEWWSPPHELFDQMKETAARKDFNKPKRLKIRILSLPQRNWFLKILSCKEYLLSYFPSLWTEKDNQMFAGVQCVLWPGRVQWRSLVWLSWVWGKDAAWWSKDAWSGQRASRQWLCEAGVGGGWGMTVAARGWGADHHWSPDSLWGDNSGFSTNFDQFSRRWDCSGHSVTESTRSTRLALSLEN